MFTPSLVPRAHDGDDGPRADADPDHALTEEHIGMIIGALAAMILLLFAVAVFIVLRSQRKKHEEEHAYDVCEKYRMTHDTDEVKVRVAERRTFSWLNKGTVTAFEYADLKESCRVCQPV